MDDFRIILIVVGLLSIVGLLAHGLWSIRRQQPRKMKARPLQPLEPEPSRDAKGFDLNGVGQVRTISGGEPEQPREPALSAGHEEAAAPGAHTKVEPQLFADPETVPAEVQPLVTSAAESGAEPGQPSEPCETPQPSASVTEPEIGAQERCDAEAVDPLFGADEVVEPEPRQPETGLVTSPEDVLVMHVVAAEGQTLHGAELLHNFLTLGMKFGEMNIFHRHQDSAGRGPVMYSLANMVNPGVFDPDTMEQFETEGVSLFMTLPNQCDETVGFSMMMGAAQALADMHGGKVLNDQHQEWSDISKERYMARIQKFESQPA
ncbi:cell division protein ZipA [Ferrimonas sediminicola]|uniref:Cell division protein ZipA n=1 Tax=Ferrimonas sediminicola TaxID=2569538 RepID=A0A4U1BHW0_9GAMM|nr:cell division protein ZipA [Ferrimonas sediminicola]TKB50657.1 cell division protein ZipA [Ferrimonas sediminicola]